MITSHRKQCSHSTYREINIVDTRSAHWGISMGETEVSFKNVYLLLKGVNENLSKRNGVLEGTTRSLTTVSQKEVETIRNKVEILGKKNSLKNQELKFEERLKLNNPVIYGIEKKSKQKPRNIDKYIFRIGNNKGGNGDNENRNK
ncbi:hypothetical protein JTB14_016404 [Gonioctena quinquepunctata]|nr:hypothetical protein JTB14_016404 [Gonioctena quinquepunctata]